MITLKDLQIQNKKSEYSEQLTRLFPEEFGKNMAHTVTFQVTEQCNLRCTYCYQIDKHNTYMPIEVGKQGIDMLLTSTPENNTYINVEKSPGIILDFIGGEPLLAIDTITELIEYFKQRTIELQHPWANRHRFSICSNGLLYFDPKFQELLRKYGSEISFSISIDGIKELHDMCRLQPNGEGSYDIAIAGVKDYVERGLGKMGSKMTLAPENIMWTSKAIQNLVELGYDDINLNCIFEKGWTLKDANKLYYQLKDAADYLIENRRYLDTKVSIFDMNIGKPMDESDNKNWCWGAGTPILTDKGYKNIEDIKIGNLVYTHDGTLQPVIDLKSHYAENTVNLKCSGVFDLIATDNHKIFTKPFEYKGNKGKKHYKNIQKTELKDIQHNDLIQLFNKPCGPEKEYPTDLAYLVGRFIGDGYTTTQNGKNIVCAFDEENELKEYFSKANIEYSIYNNKTVKEFHIIKSSSKEENILLNDILSNCGIGAENKHLPAEIFYWNKEAQHALLKGYLDADGNINKRGQTRFNTVSYRLAQEMMVLLRILGYNPTCYKNNRSEKSTIQGREVNIKDRYEIYYFEDAARTKYVHHDENNNCWTYGLKITPAKPQMVYNLTVANNHSYVAGGIVSSNCGGTGAMLAIDYKGDIYPCLRYMESSVGPDVSKLIIGNVWDGIGIQEEEQQRIKCLECITRRSQSTDECFNCPIAAGCAWCSAYNYQEFGTADHRATYICPMHKARVLANVYYWNSIFRKEGMGERFKNWVPEEWALEIIDKDELDMLNKLAELN